MRIPGSRSAGAQVPLAADAPATLKCTSSRGSFSRGSPREVRLDRQRRGTFFFSMHPKPNLFGCFPCTQNPQEPIVGTYICLGASWEIWPWVKIPYPREHPNPTTKIVRIRPPINRFSDMGGILHPQNGQMVSCWFPFATPTGLWCPFGFLGVSCWCSFGLVVFGPPSRG